MENTPLIIAAGGGLAIQLLNLLELSNVPKDKRPDLKDWLYWLPFLLSPVLSGFLAFVYLASGYDVKPVLALHLGASAPLILRAMAGAIPRSLHPIKPAPEQ